jgi:putative redox protein
MAFDVETLNVDGRVTTLGIAGAHTLVIDRPVEAGGGALGFNGGELLHLAVAGCISNDLFREASAGGIRLRRVRVTARGEFAGTPAVSSGVEYEVEVEGDADHERLEELVAHVDAVAEIPNSLRRGTPIRLAAARVVGRPVPGPRGT